MDNKQSNNWLPLESNSDVINVYIQGLGCNELLRYVDVVSFDEEGLLYVPQPVLGALFTYPCSKKLKEYFIDVVAQQKEKKIELPKNLYYMKQTADNACGTVGILHALLNILEEQPFFFNNDGFVVNFFHETQEMTPEQRAIHLEGDSSLKKMHKEAVNSGQTHVDEQTKVKHHFIAFTWKEGHVYELDGRKDCPIDYGECAQENFLSKVFEVCQNNYISQCEEQFGFNLMALCVDQQ